MGTININRDYISRKNTYTGNNKPKYIVIHETDNYAKEAGAKRHAQAQAAGHLDTSVHYYAGSDGIYEAAAHTDGTFSVGREYGGNHSVKDATNYNTINIEICVNEDGDYAKARQNAIELVKYLIQTTGIPEDRVIRHFDAKGKYCPRKMMDNPALWEDFKAQITGKTPAVSAESKPSSGQAVQQAQKEKVYGTVITDYDPLRIRKVPDGEQIGSIPKDAVVEIQEQGAEWYKVKYGNCIGYSAARYISINGNQKPEAGYTGVCTGNGVRVRSTPEFGDNIMRQLYKGDTFKVIGAEGVWTHISVDGKEGYIYSEYVKKA